MFWIVTCFMYPRVFTKDGSCGDCCLSCGPRNILGLGPLKALIRLCLTHTERIAKLDLLSLELRRLHLDLIYCYKIVFGLVMRPSSLGGGRILRRTLSVCLSVRPVILTERHVAPPSELQ